MNKRRASVSLMAVFVFAVVALVATFVFSRIEHRTILDDNERDALESGYCAESLAYLAWSRLDQTDFIKLLGSNETRTLERPAFHEAFVKQVTLMPEREQGAYSTLRLTVTSTYKGIPSTAILKGELVNPIFSRPNGVLKPTQDKTSTIHRWLKDLEADFSVYKRSGEVIWTVKDGELSYQNGRYLLKEVDGKEQSFIPAASMRGKIDGKLLLRTPLDMQGIVVIEEGAQIEGVLRIKGVIFAKGPFTLNGSLYCEGLYIGEAENSVHAVFHPRYVERALRYFPGFIAPNKFHMKKVYGE